MIEILIKYIQDKGFEVDVIPGCLLIRKMAKGQLFGRNWIISKNDLQPDFEEILYYEAHRCCEQINEVIAEYEEACQIN